MPGTARLTARNAPARLVSTTETKSSSVIRSTRLSFVIPSVGDEDLDLPEALLDVAERGIHVVSRRHVAPHRREPLDGLGPVA